MVARANWFPIKRSTELSWDAFVLIQKPSLLPAWLCLFQCQHNVGREELSALFYATQGSRELEARNTLWWSRSHLLEQGRIDNNRRLPRWKGGDHTRRPFSSHNFSLPKKQEGSQRRWLSQWSGRRAVRETVGVQGRPSGLADLGPRLRLCGPAWVLLLQSTKDQGCHVSVAVDTDDQTSCSYPLTPSYIQPTYNTWSSCLFPPRLPDRRFIGGEDGLFHQRRP